ncbi:MAG: hypothetical protein ACOCRX_05345 [Candidatus Woesearchaeota archaeon]
MDIMDKLQQKINELKEKSPNWKYYFVGAETQGNVICEYTADSIKDLFDQLYEKNLFDESKLEEFTVIDETTDTAALKMTDEEMEDLITTDAYYYNLLVTNN